MRLLQDVEYPEMYRVEYPDGEITDLVNKTRAKEVVRVQERNQPRTASRMPLRATEKPAGEFKLKTGTYVPLDVFEQTEPSQRLVMNERDLARKIGVSVVQMKKIKTVRDERGWWCREVISKDGGQYFSGKWELQ